MKDFLGAYYFVHELNRGENVETLLGPHGETLILTTNPLFLHSCLWLLKKSERHFSFRNSEKVYQSMKRFTKNTLMRYTDQITDPISLCELFNIQTGEEFITDFLEEMFGDLDKEIAIDDEEITEPQGAAKAIGMCEIIIA